MVEVSPSESVPPDHAAVTAAVTAAAAGAVAVAGKAATASEIEVPSSAGYRETEHVKAFYDSARF